MRSSTWLFALVLISAPGCAKFQDANWWVDRTTPPAQMSTASAEGIYAQRREVVARRRHWEPTGARYESENVTHWPLWWEDPFTDKGSEDGRFAWTYEDYVATPYVLGRFLLNTMGFPVSATVTPPFTVMASDGELSRQGLGYDHDAERYRPGHPGPPPPEGEPVTETQIEASPEPAESDSSPNPKDD